MYSRQSSLSCLHPAWRARAVRPMGLLPFTWWQAVETQTSKRSLASFSLPLHHSSSNFSIWGSVQGKVPRAERSQLRLAALLRGGRSVIPWHAGESMEPLQHLINLELLGRIYKWSLLVTKLLIQSVQTRQKKKVRREGSTSDPPIATTGTLMTSAGLCWVTSAENMVHKI